MSLWRKIFGGKKAAEKIIEPPDIQDLKTRGDINGLIQALDFKDWNIQLEAAKEINNLGDIRGVEFLFKSTINEKDDTRKVQVIKTISEFTNKEQITAFLKEKIYITNGSRFVLELLDKIGWKPEKAVERTLYYIYKEKWDEVEKIGLEDIEPLLQTLEKDLLTANQKVEVIKMLGKPANKKAISKLVEIYKTNAECIIEIPEMKKYIPNAEALEGLFKVYLQHSVLSLAKIGDECIEPLTNAYIELQEHLDLKLPLSYDIGRRTQAEIEAKKVMDRITDYTGSVLLQLLTGEDTVATASALIAKMGDTHSLRVIVKTIEREDVDEAVRSHALTILKAIVETYKNQPEPENPAFDFFRSKNIRSAFSAAEEVLMRHQ